MQAVHPAEDCFDAPRPLATRRRLIETDSATRKKYPLVTGLLDYFPDALAEVSKLSFDGNEKHNPGEAMHHARGKSMDHADCVARHLAGRGGFDGETRESAALAWRALALLQEELEREHNLPLPRAARAARVEKTDPGRPYHAEVWGLDRFAVMCGGECVGTVHSEMLATTIVDDLNQRRS